MRQSANPAASTVNLRMVILAVIGGLIIWGGVEAWGKVKDWRLAQRVERKLADPDPNVRQQAGWLVVDEYEHELVDRLLTHLDSGEPDPRVREALAYAVGRVGNEREHVAPLMKVLRRERDGYARQAMWLALARLDEDAFKQWADADAQGATQDPWDLVGIGNGRMQLGDFRDLPALLVFAADEEAPQRDIARQALLKEVRPVLEAIGRWPLSLDTDPQHVGNWSRAEVATLAARCAEVDLQPIADRVEKTRFEARRVLFSIGKILKARETLAGWLYGE